MTNSNSTLYLSYGAYELKAAYQRNMLAGLWFVVILAGITVLLIGGLMRGKVGGQIIERQTRDSVVIDLTTQISIKRSPIETAIAPRPSVTDQGAIPRPISDDAVIDDDAALPTNEERRLWNDPDAGFGSADGIIPSIPESGVDYIPKSDELIFVETLPEFVHEEAPEYPRMARQAGISGKVTMKALVDKEGNVQQALVFVSSGISALDDAALRAAYKCTFKPGIQNGYPVYCWVAYQVKFVLTE